MLCKCNLGALVWHYVRSLGDTSMALCKVIRGTGMALCTVIRGHWYGTIKGILV